MHTKLSVLLTLTILTLACWGATRQSAADPQNLFQNPDFRQRTAQGLPADYDIHGSAEFAYPGNPRVDVSDFGVSLQSAGPSGDVSQLVTGINIADGKWFRFSFRGLPQQNFAVSNDNLYMKVEFFGADGITAYDGKDRKLYSQIQQARKDLSVNGVRHRNGAEAWQTYSLDFCLPFPQVHSLKMSVGFNDGAATVKNRSAFFVNDFSLIHIPDPPETMPANEKPTPAVVPADSRLIPIGGRWFYAAAEDQTAAPLQFDASNANRLLYKDAGYSAPFGGNCSAWLRKGNIDLSGNTVEQDRLVPDNLVISFDSSAMILRTHGIPNHPTGQFPGVNPNSIVERISTYYIPLNPQETPRHFVTTQNNSNHALPMGPIGIAINGVVFFNPFDAGNQDATDLMDRCCGHPNQFGQYHYHKYPICVNSPWADQGLEHSPLIGFAFDGYPVYGPYESKDLMAKDVTGDQALNAFNMTYDDERGWHYHVTPGKFPYIIGGYWGTEDPRDQQRPRRGMGGANRGSGRFGPPGGGPPPNGQSGGGFGPPPGMN
jgi:hypothetical protein